MVYGLIVDIGYTGYRGDGWLPGNVHLDAVIPVRVVTIGCPAGKVIHHEPVRVTAVRLGSFPSGLYTLE